MTRATASDLKRRRKEEISLPYSVYTCLQLCTDVNRCLKRALYTVLINNENKTQYIDYAAITAYMNH